MISRRSLVSDNNPMTGGEAMADAPRSAVTKFGPPRPPRTVVPRVQPVAALDRLVEEHPVTLVAALAGAGKTVLLTEWIHHRPEGSWAWLTCDVTDADRARFWTSVIAACAHLGDGIGNDAQALLAEDPLALDEVVPSLVNDLARLDTRAALVIDDLHMVPADAVAPLGLLVERLPPAVALVVGSRSDPPLPLGRWRANGVLGELRSDQLRFSARDTAQVVAANGVELTSDDADALTARTEGWAAGVHLAALAMRQDPDPSSFVKAFAGSDHNITDYLVGEVLDQLDAASLDCLLALATLDEFDADRCRALTGRDDAADRLEAFETANLFLVRVGTHSGTYRFHQLFRDVLRGWLSARDPDRVRALHAAASSWYEEHGDITRAVRHAIDGADADRAFALVRVHAVSGFLAGGVGISSWIAELGDEVLSASSDQVLDYIVALVLEGRIDEAGRWLDYLDTLAPADPSPRFAARRALAKADWLGHRGEIAACVTHAEDAVRQSVRGEDPFVDSAPLRLIRGYDYLDRPADARAVYSEVVDRWAPSPVMQQVLLEGAIAAVELECGNLRLAGDLAEQAAAAARQLGVERHYGVSDVMRTLGALEAEAGDLTTAEQHLEAALDIAAPGRPPYALLSLVELARVAFRRGEFDEALHRLDRARAFLPPDVESPLVVRGDALAIRIRVAAGLDVPADQLARLGSGPRRAIAEAEYHAHRHDPKAAAASMETHEPGDEPRPQLERCLVEAQIGLLEGDASRVDRQLDRILDLSRMQGFARSITDAGRDITLALETRLRRGAPEATLEALERAVAEASARPMPVERAASADHVGLTTRERTVLGYLPTRLSNREIASELYVSMSTLKTHLQSTYRKLGVESRAAAVERAKHLDLL
jgi:LuxR family transcriptional regulator, maltose regulon positive regulatory protein